jgi:hypothetical protein
MKCVILQPSYIPWRGYFHQVREADVFVFYDDVQYDAHGWRNRNRIKSANGSIWLTIPVLQKGARSQSIPIRDIEISWSRDWARKHWTTLCQSYRAAPHFERYAPLLESFYSSRPRRLAEFDVALTRALADQLGIRGTRFLNASEIERPKARRTDDLLAILRHVGADEYVSGPSARTYLDAEAFHRAGVRLTFMRYDYAEYAQLHPPYDPRVSILDLLFMVGPEASGYIWGERP